MGGIEPGKMFTASEFSEEDQHGILLAPQREFELTKDISLGFIPKYRLVNAYEDLQADVTGKSS